jgi:hypothetical protein
LLRQKATLTGKLDFSARALQTAINQPFSFLRMTKRRAERNERDGDTATSHVHLPLTCRDEMTPARSLQRGGRAG